MVLTNGAYFSQQQLPNVILVTLSPCMDMARCRKTAGFLRHVMSVDAKISEPVGDYWYYETLHITGL